MNFTKIFSAANGAQFSNKKAQIYGEYLDQIEKEVTELTPQIIVKKAKPKKSPIHNFFQWDDKVAGYEHRLQQARHLISHIVVVDKTEIPIRKFHSVKIADKTPERAYISLEAVMVSADYKKQMIDKALKELIFWKTKHSQYRKVFSDVFRAIDKTVIKRKKQPRPIAKAA